MRPDTVPRISSVDSTILSSPHPRSQRYTLALEIKYNLEYQHNWRNLSIHPLSNLNNPTKDQNSSLPPSSQLSELESLPTSPAPFAVRSPRIASLPLTHDKTAVVDNISSTEIVDEHEIYLISGLPPRHSYIHPDLQSQLLKHSIAESTLAVQREWILPLSVGETWTLKSFAAVFEQLPVREVLEFEDRVSWCDAKRVLLGMVAHAGMGGDGTVTYYIMQEGEVKPRQNG